jgi:hypothetical protein
MAFQIPGASTAAITLPHNAKLQADAAFDAVIRGTTASKFVQEGWALPNKHRGALV